MRSKSVLSIIMILFVVSIVYAGGKLIVDVYSDDNFGFDHQAKTYVTKPIVEAAKNEGYNVDGTPLVTYHWETSDWQPVIDSNSCGIVTQTRTVQCVGSDGNVYEDNKCDGSKPATTQNIDTGVECITPEVQAKIDKGLCVCDASGKILSPTTCPDGTVVAYAKTDIKNFINQGIPPNHICTSNVTDMSGLFADNTIFNQDISNWDTSNVTDMSRMFYGARSFNQPIGNWDVSNVTNMHSMFEDAFAFNQPIGNWDVSKVTDMHYMFWSAHSFNRPLYNWRVGNVTNMVLMFYNAYRFNQNLSAWCVTKIKTEPSNFSYGSSLASYYKPKWGTCPRGW